jgi:dynein heavy chain
VSFCYSTTSASAQEALESRLEKRQRNNYGPAGAKARLVVFVDDLNLPAKDAYDTQPALEFVRQWIDHGFWYDRSKQGRKTVLDVGLIAAMGTPGGARTNINERLQVRVRFQDPALLT